MIPENPEGPAAASGPAVCPFCDSSETELISLFGQSLLASQHYCRNCRSVFEAVRWTEPPPDDESHNGERSA